MQLLQRYFGYIAFRHKIPGNLCLRVDFFPFSFCLVECVFLDFRYCCAYCATSQVSSRDRVHNGRLHVFSFSQGSFQSVGDTCNHQFCRPLLPTCTREFPFLEDTLLSRKVSKYEYIVYERRETFQRAQICATKVSCQIVYFGNVGQ